MLYLIGLGLGDFRDITIKGLDAIKTSEKVFLEAYTSILCDTEHKKDLKDFYGKDLIHADRDMVEADDNIILDAAEKSQVAFLVVGDVFSATTHTDLVLRAKERNIPYKVIHNASILTAVGCCGLQLYNFGEIISIPLWTENWKPTSFLAKIESNLAKGLHTLCLLDIKVKEKTIEAIIKGKNEYEPPRFMSVAVACSQLIESIQIEQSNKEVQQETSNNLIISPKTMAVGLARIGADDQLIRCDSLENLSVSEFGKPLHCLIIPGNLHPLEKLMLDSFQEKR